MSDEINQNNEEKEFNIAEHDITNPRDNLAIRRLVKGFYDHKDEQILSIIPTYILRNPITDQYLVESSTPPTFSLDKKEAKVYYVKLLAITEAKKFKLEIIPYQADLYN
jgi:hypothetical protein